MSKTIYLKEWVKPMALLHAQCVVEDEMGLYDQNSPEYQKAFEKAFYEFCNEFYVHSLTPMAQNPTIRKGVNAYLAFNNILFDGPKSYMSQNYSDPKKRALNSKRLKTAIQTIVEIYMGGRYSGSERYEYKESDPLAEDPTLYEELNRQVDHERFKRLFIASYVMTMIEELLSTKGGEIYKWLDKTLENTPTRDFRDHEFNIKFSRGVRTRIKGILGGKKLIELVLKKPLEDIGLED